MLQLSNFTAAGPAAVTHPAVARDDPEFAPGWNSSSAEATARGLDSCVVIFDRRGRLVFKGRASYDDIERRVRLLLR